jgi:hypothetical protein
MATIKTSYGTSGVAFTITIASLGSTSAQSCAAIDNTSNLYLDAIVQVKIKTAAAGTAATGLVNIYAYGSADGGTTYPEGAGTNAGVTLTVPPNLILIGQINAVANATTYNSNAVSVAAAFGGVLPAFWGIVLENLTGAALDSTAGNHAAKYQGVLATAI